MSSSTAARYLLKDTALLAGRGTYGTYTGMRLIFLGTVSSHPTAERNVTSVALQTEHRTLLFDCGEGTQHQLLRTSSKFGTRIPKTRIDKVFITHMHGDHVFGLPGFLNHRLNRFDRPDKSVPKEVIDVYGPHGIRQYIRGITKLTATHSWLNSHVRIHEIRFDVSKRIYVNESTPDRPGVLNVERLNEKGIPPGPIYGQIKTGKIKKLPDGTLASEFVSPPQPGRKIVPVILGDTCNSSSIASAAEGCDVLVHECTFGAEDERRAYKFGHSTSKMAGTFAQQVKAQSLVLTHFSAGSGSDEIPILQQQVSSVYDGLVIAAEDFMHLDVELKRPPSNRFIDKDLHLNYEAPDGFGTSTFDERQNYFDDEIKVEPPSLYSPKVTIQEPLDENTRARLDFLRQDPNDTLARTCLADPATRDEL